MDPKILMIRLTENCNAGCFMCDFAHRVGTKFITEAEIDDIRSKIRGSEFKLVRFTGGETLLHRKIDYIIGAFHEDGLLTSVITNGFLLPRRYQQILDAGLDQVVISLDGSNATLHNSLRDTPNLFENIMTGIPLTKAYDPATIIRVNTVVSPRNIEDLNNIMDLLVELGVDQWSIIPLKGEQQIWSEGNREILLRNYLLFQEKAKGLEHLRLLGHSAQWAGRSEEEFRQFSEEDRPFTPRGECHLVENVRYYVPSKERLSSCNCASYRLEQMELSPDDIPVGFNLDGADKIAEWLRTHGPKHCTGCEPINAYLGEHPGVIDKDPFAW